MERLTLEEAINHEKMMAQRKRWNGKFYDTYYKSFEKCKYRYKQANLYRYLLCKLVLLFYEDKNTQ